VKQHFSSFARSVGESVPPPPPPVRGKLVRAAGPLIRRAASSYARAASSAVSYVPSQILVFLHRRSHSSSDARVSAEHALLTWHDE
jgi:hypothetical protein